MLLFVFLALSVLIITLDFRGGSTGPLDTVKEVSQAIVAPIQRGLTTVTRPVGNFFSSIADLANLREENNKMRAELDSLRTEVAQARDVVDENLELRRYFDLDVPWFAQKRVAAQIVADAPGNYKWAVVIDKGRNDGIRRDMAVISADGLVGKIIQADARQATVLLLIDPEAGSSAMTEEGSLTGLISGNGEGEPLSFQFVEKDEDVTVGDRVFTSNFSVFPRGIPIGYISEISGDIRSTSFEISVSSYVDFKKLNVLQVILEQGKAVALGSDS